MLNMIKTYYGLTKPGIIRGNLLTATAGFLLASQGHIHMWLLLITLLGVSFVIAAGCVLNNVIDRDIDSKMARTQKRALVKGIVSERSAMLYAFILAVVGLTLLMIYTNSLTALLGVLGLVFYVVVYGIAKRRSVFGTLVGSISGALPPVAGYTAISNQLDLGAFLLFLTLVFWQMPHFYAIAMYRYKDYAAAGLPVLPVKAGMHATKVQILIYIAIFTLAALSLSLLGYTNVAYTIVMSCLGVAWFWQGVRGFATTNDTKWARGMFGFSLVVITCWAIMVSLAAVYTMYMILGFHIAIALLSLAYTTYLFTSPSKSKLKVAYALAGLTLASGTYLVLATQAHLLQACMSGLLYLTAISFGIVAARNKLSSITDQNRTD